MPYAAKHPKRTVSNMTSSDIPPLAHKTPINVTIPVGSKISFNVSGEEESADLTSYASTLLRKHATLDASDLPDFGSENAVDFGTLTADENVTFMRNGEEIDQSIGLRALADMIIVSMVSSLKEE